MLFEHLSNWTDYCGFLQFETINFDRMFNAVGFFDRLLVYQQLKTNPSPTHVMPQETEFLRVQAQDFCAGQFHTEHFQTF